jgi:hypothetical protein
MAGAIRCAAAGQLAHFAEARRQNPLIGNQDRQPLLDWESHGAARADELLFVAGKCGLAIRIEGAAEEREKSIVHRDGEWRVVSGEW